MRRRLFYLSVSVALCLFTPGFAQTSSDLRVQFADLGLPPRGGLVLGLVRDGRAEVVTVGHPTLDETTVFEFGSLTKALTGTLLARLEGEGVLSLESSINAYLPPAHRRPVFDEVTLGALATHTAGLPRLPPTMNLLYLAVRQANPYRDFDEAALLHALGETEVGAVGVASAYSNYGFGLLGYLLGRAAGCGYGALMREALFEPLGMTDAFVNYGETLPPTQAPPLNLRGTEVSRWDMGALAGAGGVKGSMRDLLALLEVALGDTPHPLRASLKDATRERFRVDEAEGIGLGWVLTREGGQEVVWHNGQTGGYSSFLGFDKEAGVGIAVLANLPIGEVLTQRALAFLTDLGEPRPSR